MTRGRLKKGVAVGRGDPPSAPPQKKDGSCDYCGQPLHFGLFPRLPFEIITTTGGVKYWDGCQEGRKAGAAEVIRQQSHAVAVAFQKKNKPYEADSPCPKCGNPIRITEYSNGKFGPFEWGPKHPHITRTCGRCNHEELQVPLDFDPDALYPAPKGAGGD